jgi:hypothetical protein
MHRDEAEQRSSCADCGAPTGPEARAFAFGTTSLICWECAVRRGGSYAADEDRWTQVPDVADLHPERDADG